MILGPYGPGGRLDEAIGEGLTSANQGVATGTVGGHPLDVGGGMMTDSYLPGYNVPSVTDGIPNTNYSGPQILPH